MSLSVPVSEGGPTMTAQDQPLPPLCSTSDVSVRLMADMTPAQAAAVPLFIADATALIRRYTGQSFLDEVTTDVLQLRSDGCVQLPYWPVIGVSYVAVINPDGSETPVVGYWWDQADIIHVSWDGGIVINAPIRWIDEAPGTVKVTYEHGYTSIPPEVRGVCAAVVIRRITEPAAHVKTMRVGLYQEQYYDDQSPGSVYLTPDDCVALKDFRRVLKSVRLTP